MKKLIQEILKKIDWKQVAIWSFTVLLPAVLERVRQAQAQQQETQN
ncbi:MAG: hypothetical protein IJ133_03350 [Clostridia bacterium]|nr:hypothetical protein [Clostridia bacterium]